MDQLSNQEKPMTEAIEPSGSLKEESQRRRARNRKNGATRLKEKNIPFETKNAGAHPGESEVCSDSSTPRNHKEGVTNA
jgi:hypothetical protein